MNRYDLRKGISGADSSKDSSEELQWTKFYGSGRRNPIISMICTAISGTAGQMKMVLSARRTAISYGVKHQYKEGMMDQVDRVLYDLKNNPYSRRIMTNIYVHQDLHEMNLYPCAYSMTFNVTKEPGQR